MKTSTERILLHWREAVPNDRLAHLVRDTARSFDRQLQTQLAIHGVAFGHWVFLRILWNQDGLSQKQLSMEAGVMEPTTANAIKAMEQLGYITRRQSPTNRKNMYVYLTIQGKKLESKLVPLAETVNRTSVQGIDEAQLQTVRTVLLQMIENLAKAG